MSFDGHDKNMINADGEPDRRDDTKIVTESEDSSAAGTNREGIPVAAVCVRERARREPVPEDLRDTIDASTFTSSQQENLGQCPREKEMSMPRDIALRDLPGGAGKRKPLACRNEIVLEKVFDGLRSRPYRLKTNLDKDERKVCNSKLRKRYHRFRKLHARMVARNSRYRPPEGSNRSEIKQSQKGHSLRLSAQELKARRRRRQELANALQQKAVAHQASFSSLECMASRRSHSIVSPCC